MASKYYYNYAIVDPAYPEGTDYWSLSAISLGDAARIHWTSDFAPDADATTELLLSNLHRHHNKITLALPIDGVPSKEPKWQTGTSYDQLLVEVAADADYNVKRKLVFYHIHVISMTKSSERMFRGPTRVVLCRVGRGGYVHAPKKT